MLCWWVCGALWRRCPCGALSTVVSGCVPPLPVRLPLVCGQVTALPPLHMEMHVRDGVPVGCPALGGASVGVLVSCGVVVVPTARRLVRRGAAMPSATPSVLHRDPVIVCVRQCAWLAVRVSALLWRGPVASCVPTSLSSPLPSPPSSCPCRARGHLHPARCFSYACRCRC